MKKYLSNEFFEGSKHGANRLTHAVGRYYQRLKYTLLSLIRQDRWIELNWIGLI